MLTKNIILLLAINFAIFESRPFPTAEFDNNSKLEKVLLQQKKASTTTGDVEYAYEAELDNLLLLTTTSTTTTVTQKQLSESSSSTSTVTVVPPAQVDYEYEFGQVDKKTSNNNSFDWTWLIVLGVCLVVVIFLISIVICTVLILRCIFKIKPKEPINWTQFYHRFNNENKKKNDEVVEMNDLNLFLNSGNNNKNSSFHSAFNFDNNEQLDKKNTPDIYRAKNNTASNSLTNDINLNENNATKNSNSLILTNETSNTAVNNLTNDKKLNENNTGSNTTENKESDYDSTSNEDDNLNKLRTLKINPIENSNINNKMQQANLIKDSIDMNNIISSKRIRKQTAKYDTISGKKPWVHSYR